MRKSILCLILAQLLLVFVLSAKDQRNQKVNGNLCVKKDLKICGEIKTKCDIDESMQALYGAFQVVDEGFNNAGGLTPDQIVALGYFGEGTSTTALGPFTPDICGHTDHTNQPGAFQAIGALQSAFLQVQFEGGLLSDPNFPYANLSQAPKLFHAVPYVTAVINNELVNVIATADVRYPGVDGPSVALISSLAQYRLRCDCEGNALVPEIVWINFYINYFDCDQD